jgi:hypothetical protein
MLYSCMAMKRAARKMTTANPFKCHIGKSSCRLCVRTMASLLQFTFHNNMITITFICSPVIGFDVCVPQRILIVRTYIKTTTQLILLIDIVPRTEK